jgi:hypothetical protein
MASSWANMESKEVPAFMTFIFFAASIIVAIQIRKMRIDLFILQIVPRDFYSKVR